MICTRGMLDGADSLHVTLTVELNFEGVRLEYEESVRTDGSPAAADFWLEY